MRYSEILENIKFRNEMTGYSHGQKDMVLKAYADREMLGYIVYSEYMNNPHINMIKVMPEYRRSGVARKLVYHLQDMYPDTEIDWGMLTDEGSMLYNSLTFREIPIFNTERYSKFKNKLSDLLQYFEKNNWQNITDEQRDLYYRLENIVDKMESSDEFATRVKRIIVTEHKYSKDKDI